MKKTVLYVRRGKGGSVTSLEMRETNFVQEQMTYVHNRLCDFHIRFKKNQFDKIYAVSKKKKKILNNDSTFHFVKYK